MLFRSIPCSLIRRMPSSPERQSAGLFCKQVFQRKIRVSRASSISAKMSSSSISPVGWSIFSDISRMDSRILLLWLRRPELGFGRSGRRDFASWASIFSWAACFSRAACFSCRGLQISATRLGRSSGAALDTDASSAAVGFTFPERIFSRVPGTASSAASTP